MCVRGRGATSSSSVASKTQMSPAKALQALCCMSGLAAAQLLDVRVCADNACALLCTSWRTFGGECRQCALGACSPINPSSITTPDKISFYSDAFCSKQALTSSAQVASDGVCRAFALGGSYSLAIVSVTPWPLIGWIIGVCFFFLGVFLLVLFCCCVPCCCLPAERQGTVYMPPPKVVFIAAQPPVSPAPAAGGKGRSSPAAGEGGFSH